MPVNTIRTALMESLSLQSPRRRPDSPNTQQFKTDCVRYLRNMAGLNIIRAYGNATTDIGAYADAGLPKANTCNVGPNAGKDGTQPIHGEYGAHHAFVVTPRPVASCRR